MKAPVQAQRQLLEVQRLDARADQLRHQRRSLPELAEMEVLEASRREVDDQRRDQQVVVDDLTAAQRKADGDVEQVKARRTRDTDRIAQGLISNPKDLERMQRELESLERRIGTLEDEELEIMESLEEAQARLTNVEGDLAAVRAELDQKIAARDAAIAVLDEQAAGAKAERETSAVGVPADLVTLYDKLRSQYGIGAAALRARRCEGCRLEINGADLRELAAHPEDDVLRCPECSRILVRTAESGL